MNNGIRKVVVVGGGTSGWLCASYLASVLGRTQSVDVVLVEAPDIGVIGVGEATIPSLVSTIAALGITESELLRNVDGAFKQAIRFEGWAQGDGTAADYFYHPFHKPPDVDVIAAAQYVAMHPGLGLDAYAKMATPQTMACDSFKAPGVVGGPDEGKLTYAYHLDAVKFGQFLRTRFEGKGVVRVEGHVTGALRNSAGDISAVVLKDERKITGDLFVDCSGFRGLLINQALDVPFRSFSRWLPCDKALAVSVPYIKGQRILPYTRAVAQKNGWIWDINLASRRGVGHVYSSEYTSASAAAAELRRFLGPAWSDELTTREISIRVGRNERLWAHNCVAIGLSGGFIEPLESTGIYLSEIGIKYLVDHWPSGAITDAHRWGYNKLMEGAYDEVLAFVFMHYYTSRRADTAFWQDFKARIDGVPNDLEQRLMLWKHKYPSVYDCRDMSGRVFGHESVMAILHGMGWFAGARSPYAPADAGALTAHIAEKLRTYEAQVSRLPSHEAFLRACGVSLAMDG